MRPQSLLSWTLCVCGALAIPHDASLGPDPSLAPGLVRRADVKRQDKPAASLQQTSGIRTESQVEQLDMVAWSTQATEKCLSIINPQTQVTNRAGVIVCYNIPLLVVSSGVFAADFRLIRIANPIEQWTEVEGDYSLSIMYVNRGAAIAPRNLSTPEIEATAKAMKPPFKMLLNVQFIGQIEPSFLAGRPDDKKLQALLTPNITVVANTRTEQLAASVSIEKTKFLQGVFSTGQVLSDQQTKEVQNEAFVLPGTKLEITPIGLYLYAAYLVVAVGIVGWGTMDRAKYRDQFRQRMATQGPGFR